MADCPECGERDCYYSCGVGRPDYQTEWPEDQGDYSEIYCCEKCGYSEEIDYDMNDDGEFEESGREER